MKKQREREGERERERERERRLEEFLQKPGVQNLGASNRDHC